MWDCFTFGGGGLHARTPSTTQGATPVWPLIIPSVHGLYLVLIQDWSLYTPVARAWAWLKIVPHLRKAGASFEGGWGRGSPRKKKERKKRKEKKRDKWKKGTMNNVKLLHIRCCFSNFSIVRWHWKIKKNWPPRKSWNDVPGEKGQFKFVAMNLNSCHCSLFQQGLVVIGGFGNMYHLNNEQGRIQWIK